MDYMYMALEQHIDVDRHLYEFLVESMEIESDFLFSCLENNIILEADQPKTAENATNDNWWTKLKAIIKSIFDKFIAMVNKLFGTDKAFIENDIPKIPDLNFDGLKVNAIPYWEVNNNTIDTMVSNCIGMLDNGKKPSPANLEQLDSREAIEAYGDFGKITIKGKTFADSVKIKFSTNGNELPSASSYEGNALKRICISNMIPFVTSYSKSSINSMREDINKFNRSVDRIENELKNRKALNESYSLLEGTLFEDTDIKYCYNYKSLLEAENETTKDNEPKVNKVEDMTKDNENIKTGNVTKDQVSGYDTQYLKYLRTAMQLTQLALTAKMTAMEERYKSYITILRGIYNARAPKKEEPANKSSNQQQENEKEETPPKKKKLFNRNK